MLLNDIERLTYKGPFLLLRLIALPSSFIRIPSSFVLHPYSFIHIPPSFSLPPSLPPSSSFLRFPHDGEASFYPDPSIFNAALDVAKGITRDVLGPAAKPPRGISQRDVPGWTRASLHLLNAAGIDGLSFGAGTPPGKPDVPPLCVWRDEAAETSAEVVLTYETAYGSYHTAFVLPSGVALVASWEGDNTGPAPVEDVQTFFSYLRNEFPRAHVHASTFDAFFQGTSPYSSVRGPLKREEGYI